MTSHMRREIAEIPDRVEDLLSTPCEGVAGAIRAQNPAFMVTVARGSSDHAAHFLKYAFEIELGLPVASLGPSLASVYDQVPRLQEGIVLAISQSGKSPDIVALTKAARQGGGLTVALVNTHPSPLAQTAHHAIDLCAGPEKSVAATKSFVTAIVAGLKLLAAVSPDPALAHALPRLPEALGKAFDADWAPFAACLNNASSAYILGRGPTLAIAHEVALKFKECCGLHAQAYSAAEVMHGPVELVTPGFPILALAARDQAETGIAKAADDLVAMGAGVCASSTLCNKAAVLPLPDAGHPLLNALLPIIPAYLFLETEARRQGRDPDRPTRLSKVTETV